ARDTATFTLISKAPKTMADKLLMPTLRIGRAGHLGQLEQPTRLRQKPGDIKAEKIAVSVRHLVLLPGFMCDQDLWTDMVPNLKKQGEIHYGNVYEDSTLEGMAQRVLDSSPEHFVLVGF